MLAMRLNWSKRARGKNVIAGVYFAVRCREEGAGHISMVRDGLWPMLPPHQHVARVGCMHARGNVARLVRRQEAAA